MNTTLENLEGVVSKLKEQGINAGELEKQRIIDKANQQAKDIIAKAEQEKSEMLKQAKSQIGLMEQNTKASLKQASRDFIEATKVSILKQLQGSFKHVGSDLFTRDEYLKELLKVMVDSIPGDKTVAVAPEMVKKMEAFLLSESFNGKIEIKPLPQSEAKIAIDNAGNDKVQFVLSDQDIQEGLFSLINKDLVDYFSKQ